MSDSPQYSSDAEERVTTFKSTMDVLDLICWLEDRGIPVRFYRVFEGQLFLRVF